jgi:LssY C-terminus
VGLARGHWPPITHVVDGDVDDARYYLVQDLIYGEQVQRVGFVEGVGAASSEAPRYNAEGDPYFTDGLRTVLFLSESLVSMSDIELLDWQLPSVMEPYRHGDAGTPAVNSTND